MLIQGDDIVSQLEQGVNGLKVSLQLLDSSLTDPAYLEVEYKIEKLLPVLDEFYRKALLNPRFNPGQVELKKLESHLISLQQDLTEVLEGLSPTPLMDKAQWILERFLSENKPQDRVQQLISLSLTIHRFLKTAFLNQIEETPFLTMVIEVVGWSEHLISQGKNDPSSVVLFGAKLAKDQEAIQGRIKLAQDVCSHLWSPSTEEIGRFFVKEQLQFYKLLLEDLEIILVSREDPGLFKTYCGENAIEIYEEYQQVIQEKLENCAKNFPFDLNQITEKLNTAIIISSAEQLIRQYERVQRQEDIQGLDLKADQYMLEGVIRTLREEYPLILARCRTTLEHIKQLRNSLS
jgi:hypothetical protein